MAAIYHRLALMIIGKGECTTNREDKPESFKQELRVIIDVLVIQLASPVILHCPDFLKLLGARIGKNFALAGTIYNPDLVEIGNNVIIGNQALVTGRIVDANRVILKSIKIGNNCTTGVRSVVMPGVEIGDNSVVAPGSIVTVDTMIPPNQIWAGIPAKYKGNIMSEEAETTWVAFWSRTRVHKRRYAFLMHATMSHTEALWLVVRYRI